MITAGIILLVLGQLIGVKPFEIWRQKATGLRVISYGLLGLVPVQLCYFEAVKFGNAPIATIIQFLGPFIISIYFLLFKHVIPTRPEMGGMLLAFVGTLLIVTHGHLNSLAISPVVLFWGGLSAIGVATNTLIPRPLLPKFGAVSVTGWGLLVAGICLNIFGPVWQDHVTLSWAGWSMIGIIIVFGTVIPFLMFAHALGYILPTTASLLDAFEPLSATVFSVMFLSVQLTKYDLVGGALVILAVMALSLNGHQMLRLIRRFRVKTD
jgi:drug/metabolite transporter (DMT)-like permease